MVGLGAELLFAVCFVREALRVRVVFAGTGEAVGSEAGTVHDVVVFCLEMGERFEGRGRGAEEEVSLELQICHGYVDG